MKKVNTNMKKVNTNMKKSDHLVAETYTWQHTILTTDKHPCPGGIRTHNLHFEIANVKLNTI